MCGFVGIADSAAPIDLELLVRMRETMAHRGPDGAGIWRSDDGAVALAHRRLAVIDLSDAGSQPMQDARGELCITYNGEIYNYRQLAHELRQRGAQLKSASDTEVILEAYRAWGTDCLQHFVGMFSFALYDGVRRVLFMARDRAGEKPFFYHLHGGRLQFASELKALLVHDAFPRELDHESLHLYLAYGYVPGDRCILRGVRKLPPAHALAYDVDHGRLSCWRYWDLPVAHTTGRPNPEELADELTELLEASVRGQLISDVPVGILLSGGVDSSLVTAVAARVSTSPVSTFTVSFPGETAYDESAHARRVAAHFGTRHTEVVAEPATVDLLPKLAAQFDEPLADSSMVPTYLVARAIRQSATVALGGDGADELFGGYQPYPWVLQQERIRTYVPAGIRRGIGFAADRWLTVGTRGRNYLTGYSADLSRSIAYVRMFFDDRARAELLPDTAPCPAMTPEAYLAAVHPGASAVQRLTGTDFRTYLPDDILVKVDRASMLTSLEVRAPVLDHRIIEFAFGRVPDGQRVTTQHRKVLLRALAARLLPPDFDSTRKQGFSLPLSTWFRGEWGGFFREVLLDDTTALFDAGAIRGLFAAQERGLSNTHRLFALTMFELWRREYAIAV